MKFCVTLFSYLLLLLFIHSCVVSNNVRNSHFAQKRKYTKGWHFSSFQRNKKMENKLKDDPNSLPIVEEKQDLTASYSSHDSMNVLIGSFSENNRLTNQIIIADSSLNETDAMINSANHQFENQSTLERITEDEPIDRQEKSRSLKIFNALHWASLGCLLGITFFTLIGWIYWIALMVIPVFALFVLLLVLSMIQKNTLSRKIPMEERGIQYKRRLLLSKIVIISSWVLLLSFLTLVLIAIIQLS